MPSLAPHTDAVPSSRIRRIHEIATALTTPYISLHVGEPVARIAPHIAEAAKATWDADETDYTANGGIWPLRAAVAEWLTGFGRRIDPEQVWVTNGGTQALYQAIGMVIEPGDEVLVPDPGYTTFTMSTMYHSGVAVPYALRAEAEFMPEIDRLEQLVTSRTRAIIVNSPSNPLGTVLDEQQARAILDFARRHDLWVISDEVYERLTWGVPHVSLLALDTDDRVMGVFSTSKTYAMTGIRVGFLVVPPGHSRTLGAIQEAVISCINVPAQRAALAAITGDQSHVEAEMAHYEGNLEAASEVLRAKGLHFREPQGAFYLWIDMSHVSDGDILAWCERFLLERGVSVAPGSAFGAAGEGWIRVCYAGDRQELLEGLSRLPGRDT